MEFIQLLGSLGATLLLALLAAYMFRNRPMVLTEQRIRRAIARAHPNTDIHFDKDVSFVMDLKSRCALAASETMQQPIAVLALGDRVVTRPVAVSTLKRPDDVKEHGGQIKLHFDDFTAPTKTLDYDVTNFMELKAVLELVHARGYATTNATSQYATME